MTNKSRPSYRREKTAVRIAQDVVRSIRRDGHLVGDRLSPERIMIEEYDVGRATLREALRYLELQGVLEMKPGPGGGPIVRAPKTGSLQNALALLLEFSGTEFRAIVECRLALEPTVARRAAERISEEQLQRLTESVELMEGLVEKQAVFLEENRRFHDIIAWSSGNPLFGHLIHSIIDISDGQSFGTDYPLHRRNNICLAHRKILEAIRNRDSDAAFKTMTDHMQAFGQYLEKKYPEVLKTPVTWERFMN